MTRVSLTIKGVVDFRYEIARQSKRMMDEAVTACGSGRKWYARWVLVDKLKQRPDRVVYFADQRIEPDEAFGADLCKERIPGSGFTVTRADGTSTTHLLFRHELHYGSIDVYEPVPQAALDDRRAKREQRAAENANRAEREAAPLFHQ